MIARSLLLFLLLIIIPQLYVDGRFYRHKFGLWRRILLWIPTIAMMMFTIILSMEKDFIPKNPAVIYTYLFIFAFIFIPKAVFTLFSAIGWGWRKLFRQRRNYANLIGLLAVPIIWYILIYGSFIGFNKLEVNHQTYTSPDVPEAFNGYRIVQFSDAHVGTYTKSNQWLLQRAVDSINALKPDLIVFTGDLQNTQPQDLYLHMDILSSLKAKDGVFSVLGNHDYAEYIGGDEVKKVANCRETISLERQMGWTLLLNEHCVIEHDTAHLIIAGMENDGDGKKFPQKGDVSKTLENVSEHDFTLMLEHDPSAWRRKIIPDGRAQLTLSGHTHKMQFSLFGWCPLKLTGKEVNGWYQESRQSLFVTAGLGGLIPFRFDATGEIVVITLRKGTVSD